MLISCISVDYRGIILLFMGLDKGIHYGSEV